MAFNIDDLVAEGLTYPKKRSCGGCTLCCKLIECSALEKPRNEVCKFCKWNEGCTIYDEAPQMCHDFNCAWLDGDLPRWMWPKDVGFVIEKLGDAPVVLVSAEEKDWCTPKIEKTLKETYQDKGIAVIDGKTGNVLLPEGWTPQMCKDEVMKAARNMGAFGNDST